MSDPRKHHYVSRAYLAGFASPIHGQLHVFDRQTGITFSTKASNVGHERDFYRIEKSEAFDDEFTLERQLFQHVDDDGLSMLRHFAEDPHRADRHARSMAMAYMAAAYLRTPNARQKCARFVDRMMKSWIEQMCQDDAEFEQFIKCLPDEVRNAPHFDLERFRQFGLHPDHYSVSLDRNWTVGLPLQALIPFAQRALSPRAWTVMQAQEGQHFITSDAPLSIVPIREVDGPIVRADSPDTIAIFPVDHARALVGFGKEAFRLRLRPRGVAAINRATAVTSHRQVFASESTFVWHDESSNNIGSAEYLALGPPGPDPGAEHHPLPPLPKAATDSDASG